MPIRLMLVLLALVAVPRDRSARAADDVWSLMSDDAAAFLVAQPLKRVSDQIQEQLQAMDRDELLLGGRPLDQLQGLVGIVSYVDDVRGGAVAWMPVPGGEPVPVFIVPATDPAKLLEANFVPGEAPNAYRLANGRTLFARIIGRDVLLSSDAAVIAAYTPTAAPRDLAVRRLDDAGASVVRRGDLVLYYRAAFVPTLCRLVGLDDTVVARVFARMSTAMTDGVMSLDFDPLALVLRTQCRVTAGADLPARDAPVAFTRVTGPPQMLAVAARLDRLFGLRWWIAAFGDAAAPARTLQIARPVTRGDAPEALLAGAVAWFDDPADTTFDPAAPDAEVAPETLGLPRLPAPAMTVFTGGTGQALRARRIDGAVAVTTIAAAAPTAPRGATFGEDGTIRAMSAWLPAQADVLVFLSGDAAVDWLRPWMPALPMLGPVDALPRFDRGAPPVAFGLQAETSTVQTTTIVPAAIVRGFYDRVASSFTNR